MKEVKTPKKPLLYYYIVALLVLLLFNFFAMPLLARQQVEEVDYGTFMTMTENKEIGEVEIESNQIIFTNKDGSKIYKTGVLDDPELVDRLHASGAEFASEIVEQMSPFLSILGWVLPLIIFIAIGQFMAKKLTDKAGGGAGSGPAGFSAWVRFLPCRRFFSCCNCSSFRSLARLAFRSSASASAAAP